MFCPYCGDDAGGAATCGKQECVDLGIADGILSPPNLETKEPVLVTSVDSIPSPAAIADDAPAPVDADEAVGPQVPPHVADLATEESGAKAMLVKAIQAEGDAPAKLLRARADLWSEVDEAVAARDSVSALIAQEGGTGPATDLPPLTPGPSQSEYKAAVQAIQTEVHHIAGLKASIHTHQVSIEEIRRREQIRKIAIAVAIAIAVLLLFIVARSIF